MPTSSTSAYEPEPLPECPHNWMLVGSPVMVQQPRHHWLLPIRAQYKQKRQCVLCGGFDFVVLTDHELTTNL